MSLDVDVAPITIPDLSNDDLCHIVCCKCRRILCDGSLDLDELRDPGDYDDDCLVCNKLDAYLYHACRWCGDDCSDCSHD